MVEVVEAKLFLRVYRTIEERVLRSRHMHFEGLLSSGADAGHCIFELNSSAFSTIIGVG